MNEKNSVLTKDQIWEIGMMIRKHLHFFYDELRSNHQIPPSEVEWAHMRDPSIPTGVNLLGADCSPSEHMPLKNFPQEKHMRPTTNSDKK